MDTNRRLTVVALMLAMFLSAMEATAVSTAMPTVIGDLGGVELYSWIFTVYMLTSTVSVPIWGKLADLFGRKPVMLVGLAVFLVGSGLSGTVGDIYQLIVFRALQGLGAGAMQTTSLTIIGDLFNLKERAKVQGFFAAVWGVAGISGPLLGGFIVDAVNWRWIFFINLPFGLVSAVLLALVYRENIAKKQRSLDWLGAALLTGSCLALLSAAGGVHAGELGTVGVLLLFAFICNEKHAPEPILPMKLFSQRLIATASVIGALAGGAMFSIVTYLPLLVQGANNGSPTEAGATLTPMMVGWPIASTIAGRLIHKTGFKIFVFIGTSVTMASTIALALSMQNGWPFWTTYVSTFIFGVGMGLTNISLLLSVQTSVPWEQRGVATASTMFFRQIGGTMVVGLLGGILTKSLLDDGDVSPKVINDLLGPLHGKNLDPMLLQQLHHVLSDALHPIFWVVAGLGVAFFLCGLLFPKSAPVVPTSTATNS